MQVHAFPWNYFNTKLRISFLNTGLKRGSKTHFGSLALVTGRLVGCSQKQYPWKVN